MPLRRQLALCIALALPLAASAQKPGMDAFFDAMAITAAAGQQSRFVVGDNVAGYFEGYTQSYGKGGGYITRDSALLIDYASYADAARNERLGAMEQVLPYGRRVRFAGGVTEEMALLSKKRAFAITVSSNTAATLAIEPMVQAGATVRQEGDVVLVTGQDGQLMALAASAPCTLTGTLQLRANAPLRSLTVVAAFGPDAAVRARALAATNPIATERQLHYAALTRSYLHTSDAQYNKALNWAKASSRMFVVEEFGTGIWAGLPWFRDNWGRDTFIALPGTLLVSGQFEDAKAVLQNFARYQNLREPRDKEYGRIPNRVASNERVEGQSIIYNTVDGTPWMLREALEYIRYTGDKAFAQQMYKLAVPYFEGAIANYVDTDGLLAHDSADTWMDARIEGKQPWSARGPRAVEIQALWYTALQTGAYLALQAGDRQRASQWGALAHKAQQNFLKRFWDGRTMADRLRDDGSRDTKVRPNQLMLLSIPFDDFVPASVQAQVLKKAVPELLYPYGIASLSQNDAYFHPRHENPEFHHKDAAYHQGTVWGWNAGFTVTGLNKFGYQDLSWQLTKNLGQQILGLGTLGTMSELLDALPGENGKPHPSGTFAQSWSVAEYARNGYQDYVGFRPNLLENSLAFTPAIPAAWTRFEAVLPFGRGEKIEVVFQRVGRDERWTFELKGKQPRKATMNFLNPDKGRSGVAFDLVPGAPATLVIEGGAASMAGKPLKILATQAPYAKTIGALHFQTPKRYRAADFPMLQSKDVLKGIVERNEYR
jgi:glycogen debranching enzyme